MKITYAYATLLFTLFTTGANAATDKGVEMATALTENGKIYIVVGVLAIVLFGLLTFLFLLDRKIKQLERQVNTRENKNNPKSSVNLPTKSAQKSN
jgi:cytochrome c biogenesis protein CcdA